MSMHGDTELLARSAEEACFAVWNEIPLRVGFGRISVDLENCESPPMSLVSPSSAAKKRCTVLLKTETANRPCLGPREVIMTA